MFGVRYKLPIYGFNPFRIDGCWRIFVSFSSLVYSTYLKKFKFPLIEEVKGIFGGAAVALRMATGRFRIGYPRVTGLMDLGSGMISRLRFLGFGPRNLLGSVSGLVFHPWISNGYPK
jgi:hypothetical protein